jgi:hypothetical protein
VITLLLVPVMLMGCLSANIGRFYALLFSFVSAGVYACVANRVRCGGGAVEAELLALAGSAGAALVGAVAEDAWTAAKNGFARLLGRGDRGGGGGN